MSCPECVFVLDLILLAEAPETTEEDCLVRLSRGYFSRGSDTIILTFRSRDGTSGGSSCMHCHYGVAQWDFSWVLAEFSWPRYPGAEPATRKLSER